MSLSLKCLQSRRMCLFIAGLVVGALLGLGVTAWIRHHNYRHHVADLQEVKLLHGVSVVSHGPKFMTALMRNFFEDVMSRHGDIQDLYEDKAFKGEMNALIETFYEAVEEEPPPHLEQWLKDGTLRYDSINDALQLSEMTVGQKGKWYTEYSDGQDAADDGSREIHRSYDYWNVSDRSWKIERVVLTLTSESGEALRTKSIEFDVLLDPGEEFEFETNFGEVEGLGVFDGEVKVEFVGREQS